MVTLEYKPWAKATVTKVEEKEKLAKDEHALARMITHF